MKIFTLENETNNITLHATVQNAEAMANGDTFRSEAGLNKLAAEWPATRLVEIWNTLPGAAPVKKFKDRQTAVSRIWKAIQTLGQTTPPADVPEGATPAAPQATDVAPVETTATKEATARKSAPKAKKVAKEREGSKTEQVIAMLQRTEGATISEIMGSMGWQKHTVRGFMAGTMKKAGYTVESFKPEGGERTYRVNWERL
jgi:Protein of unknown function (DUF3489)